MSVLDIVRSKRHNSTSTSPHHWTSMPLHTRAASLPYMSPKPGRNQYTQKNTLSQSTRYHHFFGDCDCCNWLSVFEPMEGSRCTSVRAHQRISMRGCDGSAFALGSPTRSINHASDSTTSIHEDMQWSAHGSLHQNQHHQCISESNNSTSTSTSTCSCSYNSTSRLKNLTAVHAITCAAAALPPPASRGYT